MTGLNVGVNRTFTAKEDFSSFLVAALDTANENGVIVADTSTEPIVGVVTGFFKDGKTGDTVTVQSGGFSTKVIASAAINIGDLVTAAAAGQVVTTVTNKDFIIGRAITAAANAGDIIEVALIMGYLSS